MKPEVLVNMDSEGGKELRSVLIEIQIYNRKSNIIESTTRHLTNNIKFLILIERCINGRSLIQYQCAR